MPSPVVFWRPGCPYCKKLFNAIEKDGLEIRKKNIWEDESAASFVREHNDGNEVVPTVSVNGTVLTNPSLHEIKAHL